jgi:hypothetical protein
MVVPVRSMPLMEMLPKLVPSVPLTRMLLKAISPIEDGRLRSASRLC